MATPSTYVVSIEIAGNEVVTFVPFESMDFDDYAREVSYFRFTVENPTTAPARTDTVVIVSGGVTIFSGFIMELESKKRDNGITQIYEIEAADKKILLQKSVMDFTEFTGSDSTILGNLIGSTYPDLSADFDFSTGVTSFLTDMDLTTNNDSLLDALNNLSNLAGGAAWRFDTGGEETITVDFDAGYATYTVTSPSGDWTPSTAVSGGNPSGYGKADWIQHGGFSAQDLSINIDLGSVKTVTGITLDIFADLHTNAEFSLGYSTGVENIDTQAIVTDLNAWKTWDVSTIPQATFPFDSQYIKVGFRASVGATRVFGFDNIAITYTNDTNGLQWDSVPDATDFNFDIQSGDEFAFDIDLFEGDIDDFNSITVIGGKENIAFDWTYESDGDLDHFNLETAVKDIVVYKNTGTDGTPTWTVQTDGVWGTDSLTGDGGTKDVLYAAEHHWLWFDTNPSNLSKSIRVTGTIEKPLRVRVEDVGTGDPTYATVVYDDTITSEGEAVALGDSMLQQRNALTRLTFKTYEPNLKPGQSIVVADSARGLNETLTISNIKTKWIGASGHALFTITCGEDELPSADIMIANNDKRSRKNVAGATTTTSTTSFLVDSDGTNLIDSTGDRLYEAT